MRRFGSSLVVSAACVTAWLIGGPLAAQQQAPVFRAGTTVVPLTVTVLDKDGRPVTDLKQADFLVSESDTPREILSFFPQPFVARAPTPITRPEFRTPWLPSVAPHTSRTFLFVLGLGRIQYPAKAIDGLLQFIRTKVLPQDAIAVLAFNRATNFTTDHDRIIQLLERYKREHERIVFNIKEFRRTNRRGLGQPASTQADIDAVFQGPPPTEPIRKASDLLLGMDRPSEIREKPGEQMFGLADVREVATTRSVPLTDLVTETSVLKIYAGIEYLRNLDGDKHLIFLGGELEIASADDAARMSRRANDARVTLDIIRTLGTPSVFAVPKEFADLPNGGLTGLVELQQLETAAELTGGMFTGVSMAEKALNIIDQRSRFSYLLGYEPAKPELDGAFREVRVKVNRPGVTVLFRHGYFAAEQPDPDDVNDAVAQARVESALRVDEPSTDIALDVTGTLVRSGSSQEVVVDLTINASRLVFKPSGGMHTVNVVIGAYCRNTKDQLVGVVLGRLRATVNEETYRDYLKSGLPYTIRLPATGIPYTLKVIASDYGSGLIGTATTKVKSK